MLRSTPLSNPVDTGMYLSLGMDYDLRLWKFREPSLAGSLVASLRMVDLRPTESWNVQLDDVEMIISEGPAPIHGSASLVPGFGLVAVSFQFTLNTTRRVDWFTIIVDVNAVLQVVAYWQKVSSAPIPWHRWGPFCCRVVSGYRVAFCGHRVVVATGKSSLNWVDSHRSEIWIILDFSNARGRFFATRGKYLASNMVWDAHYFSNHDGHDDFGPSSVFPAWGEFALPCVKYQVLGPRCTGNGIYIDSSRLVIVKVRVRPRRLCSC